jgi:hypothetical protein
MERDFPSPKITLRVNHILDVERHALAIAKGVGLDTKGVGIAQVNGLLHDYYQVMQIAKTAPDPHLHHSDPDAIDRVLFSNGRIDELVLGLTDFDKEVIRTAIVQHAKIEIEGADAMDPLTLMHCKIIRDADKSAIYELIRTPTYVLKNDWGFSDEQIAESELHQNVVDTFMSGSSILNSDIESPADWAILQLGYLWNVNTRVALDSMCESAATLMDNLPYGEEINERVRACYYYALGKLKFIR